MEKFVVVIVAVGFLLAGFLFFLTMWSQERKNHLYWYNEYLETIGALGHCNESYVKKDKILSDRLNHLKSDLAQLKNKKMDKATDDFKINELSIRIHEIKYLINKL